MVNTTQHVVRNIPWLLCTLLLLASCDTTEPAVVRPLPWPAPPGMITLANAAFSATMTDLVATSEGELLIAYNVRSKGVIWTWIQKLDRNGHRAWTTEGQGAPPTLYDDVSLFACADGSALALSWHPVMFMLFSPTGGYVWSKEYSRKLAGFTNGYQLRDGRFATVGTSFVDGAERCAQVLLYDRAQDSLQTIALSVKHTLWTSLFSREAEGGTLIVGGLDSTGNGPGRRLSPFLLRYDPGSGKEQAFPLTADNVARLGLMTEVRNGEFAIIAVNSDSSCSLQRWSVAGTLLSERRYTDLRISSLAFTSDGGYVVTDERAQFWKPVSARVLKLAANGDIVWEWTLSRPSEQGPHGALFEYSVLADRIVTQPDGKIVCGGTTSAFGTGLPDAWLLRLTADGRVDSTFGR